MKGKNSRALAGVISVFGIAAALWLPGINPVLGPFSLGWLCGPGAGRSAPLAGGAAPPRRACRWVSPLRVDSDLPLMYFGRVNMSSVTGPNDEVSTVGYKLLSFSALDNKGLFLIAPECELRSAARPQPPAIGSGKVCASGPPASEEGRLPLSLLFPLSSNG